MLLSLAILALIGSVLTSMLFAMSHVTRGTAETRRRNLKTEVINERIDTTIRGSSRVLAAGPHWLVLWLGDSRADSAPDLSELCRIEWDAATKEIRCAKAPAGLADANNTAYAFTDDLATITDNLAGTANFPEQVWARNVTDWTLGLDGAAPSAARFVQYSLTIQDQSTTETSHSCASLRGH
jgi:hypothetical protein